MENNNQRSISTVAELKEVFDCLNSPCSTYCSKCSDLDCAGYIWLLPEEAGVLLEHEVEIIEVNRNTRFINSFSREDGTLDLSRSYPNCVYQCEETRKCLIREIRPLTCHMYPIGPETICGNASGTVRDHLLSDQKVGGGGVCSPGGRRIFGDSLSCGTF